MLGNLSCLLLSAEFFKINLKKKYFRKTIRVSNSFDQDQALHFDGPKMGPNCFQKLSAEESNGAEQLVK